MNTQEDSQTLLENAKIQSDVKATLDQTDKQSKDSKIDGSITTVQGSLSLIDQGTNQKPFIQNHRIPLKMKNKYEHHSQKQSIMPKNIDSYKSNQVFSNRNVRESAKFVPPEMFDNSYTLRSISDVQDPTRIMSIQATSRNSTLAPSLSQNQIIYGKYCIEQKIKY